MTKSERASYMRDYRKTVEPLKEREARQEGFKAGVQACVAAAKKNGDFQLAVRLERMANHESYEVTQRRALVKSIQPAS